MKPIRIALVNLPKGTPRSGEVAAIGPPLGLLRLAPTLLEMGHTPILCDFELESLEDPSLVEDFERKAARRLIDGGFEVVGFTSMAVDTHAAIGISRLLKAESPEIVTVLGGSHAGSIASTIAENFSSIDFIIDGDGSDAFAHLVRGVSSGVRKVQRGTVTGKIVRGERDPRQWNYKLGYSLVDFGRYATATGTRLASVESGRGCVYSCTYCYLQRLGLPWASSAIPDVVEELSFLRSQGIDRVFFVNDNFINDPRHAIALSNEIATTVPGLNWWCYTTVPQLSEAVLSALEIGGCKWVFMGPDAVTESAKAEYQKRHLRRPEDLSRLLERVRDHGIVPTFALMLRPPSLSEPGEFDQIAHLAAATQAVDLDACRIRLNALAYYPGTPEFDKKLAFSIPDRMRTSLLMDVPRFLVENDLATRFPAGFPLHSSYVPESEWAPFMRRLYITSTLVDARPHSLLAVAAADPEWGPTRVACEVERAVGDLLAIDPSDRRSAVAEAFDSIFHK